MAAKGLDTDINDFDRKLTLVLDDGTKLTVNRGYAMTHSEMIKNALETDDAADSIPLNGIGRAIAEKVVEFMEHHKTEKAIIPEKPLGDTDMRKNCRDPWDAEFITSFPNQALYNLLAATNYLSMNELTHLGCAFIASKVKGQPIENMRTVLQI